MSLRLSLLALLVCLSACASATRLSTVSNPQHISAAFAESCRELAETSAYRNRIADFRIDEHLSFGEGDWARQRCDVIWAEGEQIARTEVSLLVIGRFNFRRDITITATHIRADGAAGQRATGIEDAVALKMRTRLKR